MNIENKPQVVNDEYIYSIDDMRQLSAVKHNELIQNQHYTLEKGKGESLSLIEQKVLLFVISQIKPNDTELKDLTFDLRQFCEICGFNISGGNYTMLRNAMEKLQSRVMWLNTEEIETSVTWINKVTFYKRSGKVKIRLDEDLKPYLLMLQRNYTQIPLYNIIRMKSKYGIALYELLQSYAYMGDKIRFTLDYLRKYLDCENYDNITNLKTKVLNPALRDINSYSNIYCDYELIKEGRQYTKIVFNVRDLQKSSALKDVEERIRRTYNVEKELNPNQLLMQDIINNEGEKE